MKRKLYRDRFGIIRIHSDQHKVPFLNRLFMQNVTKLYPHWGDFKVLTNMETQLYLEGLYYVKLNGEYFFMRGYGNKVTGESFFIMENGDGRNPALERLAGRKEAIEHEDMLAVLN